MNGIIYEDSDSWWTRHKDIVHCVLVFIGLFAMVAYGIAYP